jgi:peptidoglycan/xylan/chitin deacetylase (PgdA/CDA1 family)
MIPLLQKDPILWDLFTRKEEYDSKIFDKYGRFPSYASNNNKILEPIVSKFLIERGYKAEYPDEKSFGVFLSHDIDDVYQSIFPKVQSSINYLKNNDVKMAIQSIKNIRSKKIPLVNFDAIMDLEDSFGARSSFFFYANNRTDIDYPYAIENLESEIGNISDRGWEIGLHGSLKSHINPDKILMQKKKLEKISNRKIIGYRNHLLCFTVPDTWEYLSQSGFVYDATLGFADCVGFRNGMCFPFRPYNLNTNKEISIIEIPLTIMDVTLRKYMNLNIANSWNITKDLIDIVEKYQGIISILWHNNYMNGDMLRLYQKILDYCSERNAWITSGENICSTFSYLKDI